MRRLPRLSWRTATLAGLLAPATGCRAAVTESTVVCDPTRPVRNALGDAARTSECASMTAADPARSGLDRTDSDATAAPPSKVHPAFLAR